MTYRPLGPLGHSPSRRWRWAVALLAVASCVSGSALAKGKKRKKGKAIAAAAATGPSCASGMALVPGGSYNMANEAATFAAVSALCVDKTEVTLGAYRKCIKAQKCDPLDKRIRAPRLGLSEGDAARVSKRCAGRKKKGSDKHPVNCIDYERAESYCQAQGKRLPTEQEWEWAARGGSAGRVYPWGDSAPGKRACWKKRKPCAVGKYKKGRSVHGLHDLAGSLWEWTASRVGDGYTIRGGSFADESPEELKAARRGMAEGSDRLDVLGFRCVKDAPWADSASTRKAAADEAVIDDASMAEIPLKPRITLPASPTPPYCKGSSPECPPCMALVKGGAFRMTGKHGPLVRVPDTCVALTEVTTREYGGCVEAGGCLWPMNPTCKSNSLAMTTHPMNCVTFDQARTFCRALGRELPTEAQWEWIARGGAEGRIFPWGDEVPNEQLCWKRAVDEDAIQVDGDASKSVLSVKDPAPVKAVAKPDEEGTCPVARFPAGRSAHGVYDLAGNVWEWTRSKDTTEARARILRGGSWENADKVHVSAIGRLSLLAVSASRKIGFRCVAPVGTASPAPAESAPAEPAQPPAPAQ